MTSSDHHRHSSYLLDGLADSLQNQRAQAERRLRVLTQKADELSAQIKALEKQLALIDRTEKDHL